MELKNFPKKFWVITKPTKHSELVDIMSEEDIESFMIRTLGGMTFKSIVGIMGKKSDAMALAKTLLKEDNVKSYKDIMADSLEESEFTKYFKESADDMPTGIKLYFVDKDGKESWSMHFTAKDAHKAAKDYKKQGLKVTEFALMYGKKEGSKQKY